MPSVLTQAQILTITEAKTTQLSPRILRDLTPQIVHESFIIWKHDDLKGQTDLNLFPGNNMWCVGLQIQHITDVIYIYGEWICTNYWY